MVNRIYDQPQSTSSNVHKPQQQSQSGLKAQASAQYNEVLQKLQETVVARPALCLAVAVCIGVLAGWWIKRR